MEPTAAVAVIETDLRRLAAVGLTQSLGSKWLATALDEATREKLQARQVEEA